MADYGIYASGSHLPFLLDLESADVLKQNQHED